jgi:hypothetical protein
VSPSTTQQRAVQRTRWTSIAMHVPHVREIITSSVLVTFVLILLQSCTATPVLFLPKVYPLPVGAIQPFGYNGQVHFSNDQPSIDPVVIDDASFMDYWSYTIDTRQSDLNSITEIMVVQATNELDKNGIEFGGTSPKAIALKVLSLKRKPGRFFAWNPPWESELHFQASLGNGVVIDFVVPYESQGYDDVINGCIAEGVVQLFSDDRVKAYLAS